MDPQGRVFADWFTGNLRIFANPTKHTYKSPEDNSSYELPGFGSIVLIQLKNGVVTRETSFPWDEYWRKFDILRHYRALPQGEVDAISEHLAFLDEKSEGWEKIGNIDPEGPPGEEKDFSVFLTRYINTPINIPLTKFVVVKDVTIPATEDGWTIDRDLRIAPGEALLLMEMGSTDVPPGPWTPYTSGAVQVLVRLHGTDAQEIALGKEYPSTSKVINNFLRSEDEFEQTDGQLTLAKQATGSGAARLNGIVKLNSSKPHSYQEITLDGAEIPILDLKTYLEKFNLPGDTEYGSAGKILEDIRKRSSSSKAPSGKK